MNNPVENLLNEAIGNYDNGTMLEMLRYALRGSHTSDVRNEALTFSIAQGEMKALSHALEGGYPTIDAFHQAWSPEPLTEASMQRWADRGRPQPSELQRLQVNLKEITGAEATVTLDADRRQTVNITFTGEENLKKLEALDIGPPERTRMIGRLFNNFKAQRVITAPLLVYALPMVAGDMLLQTTMTHIPGMPDAIGALEKDQWPLFREELAKALEIEPEAVKITNEHDYLRVEVRGETALSTLARSGHQFRGSSEFLDTGRSH